MSSPNIKIDPSCQPSLFLSWEKVAPKFISLQSRHGYPPVLYTRASDEYLQYFDSIVIRGVHPEVIPVARLEDIHNSLTLSNSIEKAPAHLLKEKERVKQTHSDSLAAKLSKASTFLRTILNNEGNEESSSS